jgi:hypothetical protein
MKISKNILVCLFILVFAAACDQGIDPISPVQPGPDLTAPVITIKYPLEGTKVQVPSVLATINIQFEATDDIELKTITVLMDGVELTSYSQFKDYRRAVEEYTYDKLSSGPHVLTVKATDKEGKVTETSVNFEKKPPYTPIYPGEIFYMPFDGDYMEKVSVQNATIVGTPGFAGQALKGTNAYAGAAGSYLTLPTTALKNPEFSAAFWLKVNAVPDRAGILTMSAPDPAAPTNPNYRKSGFRFFREDAAGKQRFKLNVGIGGDEKWFDGGAAADVDASAGKWVHFAFTISGTEALVYINGKVVSQGALPGINWDGCDLLSIMSGAPRFIEWGHLSDLSYMDELRIFNKALTQGEIQNIIQNDSPYVPKYSGEVFYMPFEGNSKELNSNTEATVVGSPTFVEGKVGQAYAGATDSYLTFPTTNLTKTNEVSAAFWIKTNATPDRAGILTMSPEDLTNAKYPDVQNKRTSGFRFFRENSGGLQQFKVNVGFGTGESWNDGGKIDPKAGTWVHMAFTVSATTSVIYIDGVKKLEGKLTTPIDWTGCDLLTIMSGVPRFTEWQHFSDLSSIDELRIFNKSLSQDEVNAIMNAEK